jgi:hypothetical protein
MDSSTHSYWTERIESLKAGGFSALATGSFFGLTIVLHQLALQQQLGWQVTTANWLVGWAIAIFSGFLFGVTYRYIIREDENPHLKSGAVTAFGLVRGLAQADASLSSDYNLLPLALSTGESILLFAVARLLLDWALSQGWLKPFRSN